MSLADDIRNIPLTEWTNGWTPDVAVTMLPGVSLVEDEIIDEGRWFIYHRAVLKRTGGKPEKWSHVPEYAAVEYPVPATEYQEVDDEPIDVYDVVPETVRVTRYRRY